MDDVGSAIQVTNGTSVDVALIDSALAHQGGDATRALIPVVKSLKTPDGASTVPSGASAHFPLNDTYVDPTTGETEASLFYHLIVATSD